jgi:hypothetical protein
MMKRKRNVFFYGVQDEHKRLARRQRKLITSLFLSLCAEGFNAGIPLYSNERDSEYKSSTAKTQEIAYNQQVFQNARII